MSTLCGVDGCGRPTPDLAYVCQPDADRLSRALGDAGALWDELQITITKQARFSNGTNRGGEKALPFNPTASEVGWVLRNTLATWCRVVAEERGHQLPVDNPASIAAWLLNQVTWLRHHRAGPEAVEEITSAVNAIAKVIDRPAEQVYAGPCLDCGEGLYGKLGATSVDCRECGREHDVSEMQEWMLAEAASRLVTAREAVILLGRMGRQVRRTTIDTWAARKRLVVRGHDAEGVRLYLFADLEQLTRLASVPSLDTPGRQTAS